MSRPFFPSALLTALALACHVRPRFLDEWPQREDANLISRTGTFVAQLSTPCPCARRDCRV